MLLGEGSYGAVYKRDNNAVKKFEKRSHLVQEWMAGFYLRNMNNIVHLISFNLRDKEITMKLHQSSLRQLLNKESLTGTDKLRIFHDILCGLNELHSRGLVHGDIKPGNILVDMHPVKAVLGDLGFVSKKRYAKVERTAANYRDPKPQHSPAHDMFSIGILMIELFGKSRLPKKIEYNALREAAYKCLPTPIYQTAELLLSKDPEVRPNADKLLRDIFNENKDISRSYRSLEAPEDNKIKDWMRDIAKVNNIHRYDRGYKAIIIYLFKNGINYSNYRKYSACMLFVLSSLFGKSGFNEERIISYCGEIKLIDIWKILEGFMQDYDVVSILFKE